MILIGLVEFSTKYGLFSCTPSPTAFRLCSGFSFYNGERGHKANYKVVQIVPLLESFLRGGK